MSAVTGVILLAVFAAMIVEAVRAASNERAQRQRGGVEPPGDVYAAMKMAYPSAFLLMFAEGAWRGSPPSVFGLSGAVVLVAAKGLKWWAIRTLGPAWTFRVVVVPGARLVARGPYRWMRHPNYVAVVGEFVGVALVTGARVTGPVALAAFGALMWRRVTVENQALSHAARETSRASKLETVGPIIRTR